MMEQRCRTVEEEYEAFKEEAAQDHAHLEAQLADVLKERDALLADLALEKATCVKKHEVSSREAFGHPCHVMRFAVCLERGADDVWA